MRKGWTVPDECVFVDDGISGAEFQKRPGLLRLINARPSATVPGARGLRAGRMTQAARAARSVGSTCAALSATIRRCQTIENPK
jgi:hypothetical protein